MLTKFPQPCKYSFHAELQLFFGCEAKNGALLRAQAQISEACHFFRYLCYLKYVLLLLFLFVVQLRVNMSWKFAARSLSDDDSFPKCRTTKQLPHFAWMDKIGGV